MKALRIEDIVAGNQAYVCIDSTWEGWVEVVENLENGYFRFTPPVGVDMDEEPVESCSASVDMALLASGGARCDACDALLESDGRCTNCYKTQGGAR